MPHSCFASSTTLISRNRLSTTARCCKKDLTSDLFLSLIHTTYEKNEKKRKREETKNKEPKKKRKQKETERKQKENRKKTKSKRKTRAAN
jgi:hypothetical protein